MTTDICRDFDKLLEVIKTERNRLQRNLASIEDFEELDDVDVYLETFKTAILPMIQTLADDCISYVEDSDISELQALQDEIKGIDMNKWSFRRLVNKYNHDYYCSRYLFHIAFLHGFDYKGLCQDIMTMYQLLSALYDRCAFLTDIKNISDDSLERLRNLFHGYY